MSKATCTSCSEPPRGRGLCADHYWAWYRAATKTNGGPLRLPLEELFWAKVDKSGDCWLWTGGTSRDGYGRFRAGERHVAVHRFSLELAGVVIPDDMQVDHLCHDPHLCTLGDDCPHRACVNPGHLAVVTPRENGMRSSAPQAVNAVRTECKSGHPFDAANTYINAASGNRQCRTCTARLQREYRARKRAAVA